MNIKIHNTIKIIAFLQMLLIPGFILAQKPSAGEILEAVKDKMSAVKSYEAHITINVDVDFINMKERKGTVTFRHPNVLEFDTQGFALLPKRGMEMEYMQLLNTEYTAIDVGEVTIQEFQHKKLKLFLPLTV